MKHEDEVSVKSRAGGIIQGEKAGKSITFQSKIWALQQCFAFWALLDIRVLIIA